MYDITISKAELAKLCLNKARKLEQAIEQKANQLDPETRDSLLGHAATLMSAMQLLLVDSPTQAVARMLWEAGQLLEEVAQLPHQSD